MTGKLVVRKGCPVGPCVWPRATLGPQTGPPTPAEPRGSMQVTVQIEQVWWEGWASPAATVRDKVPSGQGTIRGGGEEGVVVDSLVSV